MKPTPNPTADRRHADETRTARPAALLGVFLLAALALPLAADTNAPAEPPAPAAPPTKPRDFYNAGTRQLEAKKLRDAEVAFMTAATRDQRDVQTHALYNLGHTRFEQGVEALKQSPDPKAVRERGEAAGGLADRAIRSADAALASGEIGGLLRAYIEGRGARKELREAMKALDKALEAHRTTLLRWQRASGDFKSAHELRPALEDARFNGEVVDQHIVRLVDQQEMLMQCMGGMGDKLADLRMKLNEMKGQIPGGMLPKGGEEDEDEDDEEGGPRDPQDQQGQGREREREDARKGRRQGMSEEEAAMLLNSFKLDANRKLPMGDRDTGRPEDRKGKDY